MKVNGNFIAGEWRVSGDIFESKNPSDLNDIVVRHARGSVQDVEDAVAAACDVHPEWARFSSQDRHDILARIARELLSRADELGQLLAQEEGKTRAEGIGEVGRAGRIFEFFAAECLRTPGEIIRGVNGRSRIEVEREPVGVVAAICPWNFPIAIPAWKAAPALAHGNCVLLKTSEVVPAMGHALADIIGRAGVPAGVFNFIVGRGSEVGARMADHPGIDGITFTGSAEVGRSVLDSATATWPAKKVQLEMGGKNALVVLDDADLDTAVECALNGAFYSTGQRCTASSRLIVTEGIADTFVEALVSRMRCLKVGHALDPDTDIGPVASEAQLATDLEYIQLGQDEGARLAEGGELLSRPTSGHFFSPALFVDVEPDMRIAREEIFGPIAGVIRVKNYDAALQTANDSEFGLSAGICTTSLQYAEHFRHEAEAGMVMVNLPTAGVDYHVPFGGSKGSSYGPREQGRAAAEFFTRIKTAYIGTH